jgi:glycerol kinase
MNSDLFLGIDQGSSSTKAILINGAGEQLESFHAAVPARIEQERCVEQDPEGLLSSVVEVILKAKEWAHREGHEIRGAALASQRSGVLAWRAEDGVPVHPMITWADTRTHTIIQNFGRGVEAISQMTGLPTIPHFAAGKIHLLQRRFLEPSVLVGTLDTFLLYRLSKREVFITEDTMAARTMLYSLADKGWSDHLSRQFQVDKRRLAPVKTSLGAHAVFEEVPIVAMLGDQQAALIGRSRGTKRPLLNLGTIASLVVDTGAEVVQKTGLMTSVLLSRMMPSGYARETQYLIETTSPITGTVLLEPLRKGWYAHSQELNDACCQAAQANPKGLATAYFLNQQPVLPRWPDGVPNTMVVKSGATDADRARAIVENVGNLIVRMLEEFADKGLLGEVFPAELDVAGGGSELDYLIQYIADVSGHILHRLKAKDASARGAALCAWMATNGQFYAHELNNEEPEKTYRCENPERRQRYILWQRMEQDVLNDSLPPHATVERFVASS